MQAHSQGNTSIYSLLELSDNTIITFGENLTMKHYKFYLNEKKLEELQELYCRNNSSFICRVIELSNKNLVSCDTNHILFWSKSSNNKYEIIKDIADFGGRHLFLMNENYIIVHNNNGLLKIYNHDNNYKLEKQINNIYSNEYMHRFAKINNDLFCLGEDEFLYIFSISKMELVSDIQIPNMKIQSILILANNTILGGTYQYDGNYHLIQYKINEQNEIKEISRKEKAHSTIIWELAILSHNDEGEKIISVSDDGYLKIWELNYFFP